MLHGVHFRGIHHRFVIGLGQPQVEGGDGFSAYLVLTAYVYATQKGVVVDGVRYSSCKAELLEFQDNISRIEITLTEGKYHQIKLMLKAVCNKIIYLERVKFGPISLDKKLARGEWRFLDEEEQKALEEAGKFRN